MGRSTGGSGKAPGFAAEHPDETASSHRAYYGCICQNFEEASHHQRLVDAYIRNTEHISVSLTVNNKGGWSRTLVGPRNEGEGGRLTPGSTLTQEQLYECLDLALEATELRMRHNAMHDAAGLQVVLLPGELLRRPGGAPSGNASL